MREKLLRKLRRTDVYKIPISLITLARAWNLALRPVLVRGRFFSQRGPTGAARRQEAGTHEQRCQR